MEPGLAILGAGPIGYFTKTRRRGWELSGEPRVPGSGGRWPRPPGTAEGGLAPVFLAFNVPILARGVGLKRLGSSLGERRRNVALMELDMA
jgi:hypothetical protein